MGDAGEGLIDQDSRIQERQDELEQSRKEAREKQSRDPRAIQEVESLRLARAEMARQLVATVHPARRSVLAQAIAELDLRTITAKAAL